MSSTSIYTVPEQWRLQLFKNPPEPISHYDLDELWQTCVHELFQTADHWGENNPHWGIPTSEKQKEAVRLANSVPKPYVSKNMKKLHAEGVARQWNKSEAVAAGKASQAKKPKWWTNGKDNLYLPEGQEAPSGYRRGRTTGWKTHP